MVSWTLIQFLSARSQVKPEITRDFVAFAVNQDQFQQSYILKGKKISSYAHFSVHFVVLSDSKKGYTLTTVLYRSKCVTVFLNQRLI